MHRVAIVQARMTSTRLPGKVMKSLAGAPMLAQQLKRLRACRNLDEICIATTSNSTDDVLFDLAQREKLPCFRGSERDVLGRYLDAAKQTHAEIVVRITADCPLVDPPTVDLVVEALVERPHRDYAANVLRRTFPQGLDCEALWFDVLARTVRLAESDYAREHVTAAIYGEKADLFARFSVEDSNDNSDLRWTVDTPADWQLIETIYRELDLGNRIAPYVEMLHFARQNPELMRSNQPQT